MKSDDNDLPIEQREEHLEDSHQVVRLHAATMIGQMEEAHIAASLLFDLLQADNGHDRKVATLISGLKQTIVTTLHDEAA